MTTSINMSLLVDLDELNLIEIAAREAMQTWFNDRGLNPEIYIEADTQRAEAVGGGSKELSDLLAKEKTNLWALFCEFFDQEIEKRNELYKESAEWIEDGDLKVMVFARIDLDDHKLYWHWCFIDNGFEGEDSRGFDTYDAAYADAEAGIDDAKAY